MKLEIKYPIITFEIMYLDVNDEVAEDILNACQEEQADFILGHIPDDDYTLIPNGKKGIISALDTDIYAHIKEVKP